MLWSERLCKHAPNSYVEILIPALALVFGRWCLEGDYVIEHNTVIDINSSMKET
jgi:hypothetical protein